MSAVVPANESAWFRAAFLWWMRRFVARRFHAVRAVRGSAELLARAAAHEGPLVVCCNHQSWWDPLVGLAVHEAWFRGRPFLAPMDRTQLEKFGFFRRLGVFGVDPDDAAGLRPFARHVEERFAADGRAVLMLTPQGKFVDPRCPVEVRPGAAMVAAQHPKARVLSVALEYAFWTDQRPEVFLRAVEVPVPAEAGDTRAWKQAIEDAMNRNAAALAAAVMGRDPAAFDTVAGGGEGRIHPLYDAALRASGRSTSIETAHRGGAR